MNKILLTITILLTSNLYSFSQTIIPLAGFQGEIIGSPTESNDTITALLLINDFSNNFTGLDLSDTMNIVLWKNCQRYEVTEFVSLFANQVTIKLYKGGNNTLHRGFCALLQENESLISHLISGITDSDKQCIDSYYRNIVSSGGSGGKFVDGTDTDDAVYMDGKVGIGTNSPSAGLHVLAPSVDLAIFEDNYGGTAPAIVLDNLNGGASAGGRLSFRDSGTERAYVEYQKGTGTTPSIRLGAAGSEVMRIKSDGKVGIGITNPNHKLQVYEETNLGSNAGDTNDMFSLKSETSNADFLNFTTRRDVAGSNWETAKHRIQRKVDNSLMGYMQFGSPFGSYDDMITFGYNNTELVKIKSNGDTEINGDAEIKGELTAENQIQVKGSNNASTKIEIGVNRTSDNYSWIDLIGDNTYTDYGLRIVRNNTGANTSSDIHHRGTGNLNIKTREAAPIVFSTTNAERMRIKSDGKVGIGIANPDKLLVVSGDGAEIVINDTDTTDNPRIRLRESGATSGSIYTDAGELIFDSGTSEKMRIDSDGNIGINNTNPQAKIHLDGQQIITNSNGTDGASMFIGRGGNVSQAAEINFVENSSASYAYGFRFRLDGVGNKLYLEANNGSVGAPLPFDLMAFNRTGGVEVENSLSVNGTYSGEYPKDSGWNNVVFGSTNFSDMTSGLQNFVSGERNGETATSINRSTLFGLNNARYSSGINYTFSAGAYNNENNLTGCSYNFMNGYLNAREAQGMSYSFFNGRENAESASQAGYSFYNGLQNLHSSAAATNYNFMVGRENAKAAFDSDYSFLAGYRNVFLGAANLDFSFIAGLENAYNSAGAITSTTLIGSRNGYTTTGTLSHSTMIGFENGKLPTVALNNTILLGFRQGYSIGSEGAAAFRLAIGMIQDNPLIYGEFDNAVLKVNGSLTVTDRIGGIATKGAAFDDTGQIVETDSLSISNSNQNILDGVNRLIDVDGKLSIAAGTVTNAGLIVSDDGLINGDKYVAINANVNSTTADGFYAIENEGIRIRVGDEDEGRILYSSDGNGDAVWGQADNVGRITTTLGLWSDERQVLLAGTAYGSFGAFTFPPSGWTTSQQHDGDVLTLINRSGGTRQLTGDIEGTLSLTVDVLDDDTIRLVYYEGGDYWIVLSNN
jgi:hypothetical protein